MKSSHPGLHVAGDAGEDRVSDQRSGRDQDAGGGEGDGKMITAPGVAGGASIIHDDSRRNEVLISDCCQTRLQSGRCNSCQQRPHVQIIQMNRKKLLLGTADI